MAANYLGFTHEVEFNVYVYPESRLPSVPLMSVRDYLLGRDQTKTIGGSGCTCRADNPNAVAAGKQNFGEPKWLAAFDYIPAVAEQRRWHRVAVRRLRGPAAGAHSPARHAA